MDTLTRRKRDTGHWAEQAFVEGEIPFSGRSSNGGFWSRKVENA
jgi:hypothetical protein